MLLTNQAKTTVAVSSLDLCAGLVNSFCCNREAVSKFSGEIGEIGEPMEWLLCPLSSRVLLVLLLFGDAWSGDVFSLSLTMPGQSITAVLVTADTARVNIGSGNKQLQLRTASHLRLPVIRGMGCVISPASQEGSMR